MAHGPRERKKEFYKTKSSEWKTAEEKLEKLLKTKKGRKLIMKNIELLNE